MSEPLRIIYAGTPDFSVAALEALIASEHQVIAVYTQPDRPAGRSGCVYTAITWCSDAISASSAATEKSGVPA